MKKLFFALTTMAIIFSIACNKKETIVNQETTAITKKTRNIGSHLALERNTSRVYIYAGTGTNAIYAPLGTLLINGTPTVLPSVTGIANVKMAGSIGKAYVLSRPSTTSNWQIWLFPSNNPSTCFLHSTILGSAAFTLHDLEYEGDPSGNGRFLALRGFSPNSFTISIPYSPGNVNFTNLHSNAALQNVNGLTVQKIGANWFHYVMGFNAGNQGFLMQYNSTGFQTGTPANAIFTPSLIPTGGTLNGGGCWYDFVNNEFVIGGAQSGIPNNWTRAKPTIIGGGLPASWQLSNNGAGTFLIFDFANNL